MKKLFLIFLLSTAMGLYAQNDETTLNFLKGAEFYKKGDFKNAFYYIMLAAKAGDAGSQGFIGDMYNHGQGVDQNYQKAFEWYTKAANQGDKHAQCNLGMLYEQGDGVNKNYLKAYEWYLKSANQGLQFAQNRIGDLYYYGNGVKQDYLKAYEWYSRAADQDNMYAQNSLGYMYHEGLGVKQDYIKAFSYFSKSAEQGHWEAQYSLGNMYNYGLGIKQDYLKAFEWYSKAAEFGLFDAQIALGNMYSEGRGINQDYMKAYEWYSKAAEGGNAEAQNLIGNMYLNGNGVNKDYLKALEWYIKSAEQEYAEAQYNVGYLYYAGLGVKQDFKRAFDWYKKAAEQGITDAQYCIGFLYNSGKGVQQDYKEAYKWFLKSEKSGDWMSQYCLGRLFLNGLGVKKDLNEAEVWFKKSIESNADNPYSYSRLALIYTLRDKDYKKALDYSDIALSCNAMKDAEKDQTSKIYGTRGHIFYLNNDMANAEKMLAKCLDLNPDYMSEDEDFAKLMVSYKSNKNKVNDIFSTNNTNKNIFAIIIGNELYKNEADVPFANNDAKVFCEYVEKTLGVPHDQIRLIENAGYNDIRISVNWLTQAMKVCRGKGKAIVYYAGHGIPNESDLSAYLLPVDGIGNDPSSAYALNELYEKLGSVEAQSVTIFLDACFSGSKREEGMLSSARGVAIKAKTATPKGNIIVFSAAQGDETAYPYKDKEHGMFTYYLLKKLQDSKGEVTLGELGDYLIDEVGRESFVKNGKMQTPTVIVAPSLQNSWKNLKLK